MEFPAGTGARRNEMSRKSRLFLEDQQDRRNRWNALTPEEQQAKQNKYLGIGQPLVLKGLACDAPRSRIVPDLSAADTIITEWRAGGYRGGSQVVQGNCLVAVYGR